MLLVMLPSKSLKISSWKKHKECVCSLLTWYLIVNSWLEFIEMFMGLLECPKASLELRMSLSNTLKRSSWEKHKECVHV